MFIVLYFSLKDEECYLLLFYERKKKGNEELLMNMIDINWGRRDIFEYIYLIKFFFRRFVFKDV